MTYAFATNTVIPIDAFTTFGVNAKPNSGNPIGYFGTGLKYAVAVILRQGGTIRVLVDGTEYEFYTTDADFRGKHFKKIRMKKRGDILGRWRYEALPFTTELGKNWDLWHAYRELESNTRDERGSSYECNPASLSESKGKTIIEVNCAGFEDVVNQENDVFLDDAGKKVFENRYFTMYDKPSKYLYYRGVRVYDMRYPARFTYDFKQGHVDLSEDRSARNSFMLFWYISGALMREVTDKAILQKALNKSKDDTKLHFEGHDLSFSSTEYGISNEFREVAKQLSMKGFATQAVHGVYLSMIAKTPEKETIRADLTEDEWHVVLQALKYAVDNGVDLGDVAHDAEHVLSKLEPQVV